MVPIYLDSQVAVMALGGSIPIYPHKNFGGSKTLELQDTLGLGYMIRLSNTILVFEPCGFLGP